MITLFLLVFVVHLSEGLTDEEYVLKEDYQNYYNWHAYKVDPHEQPHYEQSLDVLNPNPGSLYEHPYDMHIHPHYEYPQQIHPHYEYPQHIHPQYIYPQYLHPQYVYPRYVYPQYVYPQYKFPQYYPRWFHYPPKPTTEKPTEPHPAPPPPPSQILPTTLPPHLFLLSTLPPPPPSDPLGTYCQEICKPPLKKEQLAILKSYKKPSLKRTPQYSRDCTEAGSVVQGVVELEVEGSKFNALCIPDPEDGPSWTVIQRRVDGSVDFNRNWEDYENGFGELTGSSWLGLKNIFILTNIQLYTLWIKLKSSENRIFNAYYQSFCVDNATEKYRLNVCLYGGNATDGFGTHSLRLFCTPDNDNDGTSGNIAKILKEGYWMSKPCDERNRISHLNGDFATTLMWKDNFKSPNITYVHMAIRPNQIAKPRWN